MKLFIFDCDGTLADSQHMIVAAMNEAFAVHGLPPAERARVLSVVGLSLETAVRRLLPPRSSAELVAKLADDYKAAFHELRRVEHVEPLYEGIREVIETLAAREDVRLGIATGKSRRGLDVILERERLGAHFSTIQTADTHPSKPHPSMILTALDETGALPERTLMIGDTTYDMEMARAAGVGGLGVAWGYHEARDLKGAGAHLVVERSGELLSVLDSLLALMETDA